jgi:hypothetical protein
MALFRKNVSSAVLKAYPCSSFAWWVSLALAAMLWLAGCASMPWRHVSGAFAARAGAARSPVLSEVVYPYSTGIPTPYRPLSPTAPVYLEGFSAPPPAPDQTIDLAPENGWQAEAPLYAQENFAPDLPPEPTSDFYGIDFDSPERVTIEIIPPDSQVNQGEPIKISFRPGERCRFSDLRACTYAYKPTAAGNLIVITVHSGVGGAAQRFRNALEGTGINRASFSLEEVDANMQSLAGATVVIRQGERSVENLHMQAVTRIPARALTRYFRASLAEILSLAAELDPQISELVYPEQPQIVLETCGWKMPGEAGAAQVSDTTGSVYLGIIR